MWNDHDTEPFYKMCSDQKVMRYFTGTLSHKETTALIGRIKKQFDDREFGLYALDHLNFQEFIGFIGFLNCDFESDFTLCE